MKCLELLPNAQFKLHTDGGLRDEMFEEIRRGTHHEAETFFKYLVGWLDGKKKWSLRECFPAFSPGDDGLGLAGG